MLRPWFQGMLKKALLWPGKWASQKRAGKTMQLDLEIARAQWINDAQSEAEKQEREASTVLEFRTEVGQADFHALRHTYLSRLGRSGVSAKAMQKLARHSTVELTIGRYTHTNINDLGSAVQQMTPLPLASSTGQSAQPNGSSGQNLVALMVAGFPDNHCKSMKTTDNSPPTDEPVKPENTDSRNPCQRTTLDTDCGCLSAIDKAERQGNAATVFATCFREGTYATSPNGEKICEFSHAHSRSQEILRDHRVLNLSFHKCFTRLQLPRPSTMPTEWHVFDNPLADFSNALQHNWVNTTGKTNCRQTRANIPTAFGGRQPP